MGHLWVPKDIHVLGPAHRSSFASPSALISPHSSLFLPNTKTLHWFGSYLQLLKDVGLSHVFCCLVLGLSFYDSLLPLVYLTKLTLSVNVIKCNLFSRKAFPSLHYGADNSLPCILLSSHQWHRIPFIVYRSVFPLGKGSFFKSRVYTSSYFEPAAPRTMPGIQQCSEKVYSVVDRI